MGNIVELLNYSPHHIMYDVKFIGSPRLNGIHRLGIHAQSESLGTCFLWGHID